MKKLGKKKVHIIAVLLFLSVALIMSMIFVTRQEIIFTSEDRTEEFQAAIKEFEEQNVVGWIRVQGTNIDIPVLGFEGWMDLSSETANFAWKNTLPDETHNRIVIEGHNIRNVSSNPMIGNENHSRFEQLKSFVYEDFARENLYIEYFDGEEKHIYAIYGIGFIPYSANRPFAFDMTRAEKRELIEFVRENSYFEFDIEVTEEDRLLTLITCTRMFGSTTRYSFVVNARRLRSNEQPVRYDMRVRDNYEILLEAMRGDGNNEEI